MSLFFDKLPYVVDVNTNVNNEAIIVTELNCVKCLMNPVDCFIVDVLMSCNNVMKLWSHVVVFLSVVEIIYTNSCC